MRRFITIIFLTFLGSLALSAQRSMVLTGFVFDEKRQPLEYVDVVVDGTTTGTSTDSRGYYRLQFGVSAEHVSVKYSMLGYADVEKQVAVSDSVRLNVSMAESVEQLGTVDVKEMRKQTEQVQIINVDRLKDVPNPNGSIETILATQAGVSNTNELSSQYSVRGGNYDENCVYVNNVEIYRPLMVRAGEQEGLSFVNPDMVGEIAFSTGGFSAEYGDKMSSVLDIKYKQPKDFEGAFSVSLLGASAYLGAKTGKFSQLHGVRYKSNQYLLGSLETDGEYKPKFFDYQTYLTQDFTDKWQLSFLGNISRNDYRFIPKSRSTKFGTMQKAKDFKVYFDGQEKDLFVTYFGNLALKFTPNHSAEFQLSASSFHTSESVNYDINGEYWLSDVDGSSTINTDVDEGIGSYHEHARDRLKATVSNVSFFGKKRYSNDLLKWGFTVQHEHVNESVSDWEMRDSAGYSIPFVEDDFSLYYNLFSKNTASSNRLLAYLMDSHTFNSNIGRFILNGGIRMNYWTFNEELLFSPRASLAFFPSKNDKWGFRVAAGRYFQSPFYKEMRDTTYDENGNSVVRLNKDIKAQRSFQVLLASDYYFKMWQRPFKFSAELYGKYIDRLIPYSVDNVKIVYAGENNGDGYVAGADFKLFGEFIPGTDSWVSLSLMQAKENIYGDGAGYIYRPTDQRYNVSMFFQDYLPGHERFKVNLKLVWADGLPFGPPHSERKYATFRTSAYRRVDIGAAYEIRQGRDDFMQKGFLKHLNSISVGLDVLNLFDIKNVNSYYWVTDVNNMQYAVPNYLTSRQLNVHFSVSW